MSSAVRTVDTGTLWGPQVDHTQLKDLYAPQQVGPRFCDIPAGIDNLKMTTIDTFLIPGKGEVTAVFKGYVRVARAAATTDNWATSVVYTNMLDIVMSGQADAVGTINVSINPNVICAGQITTPYTAQLAALDVPAKNCRIAVSTLFEIPKLGVTLFNKEPIMLCIDGITTMPPGGAHGIGRFHNTLPLYNLADPNGTPAAWLTRLEFDMGAYITEDELAALKAH